MPLAAVTPVKWHCVAATVGRVYSSTGAGATIGVSMLVSMLVSMIALPSPRSHGGNPTGDLVVRAGALDNSPFGFPSSE